MEIPNKLYFRIGDVSDIVAVKPYVLRYWESEFTDIKPSKSRSGQRLYKRKDVELLILIKDLLHEKRFTIDGARKFLKERDSGISSDGTVHLESQPEEVTLSHDDEPTLEVEEDDAAVEAVEDHSAARIIEARMEETKKVFKKVKQDLETLLQFIRE